MDSENEKMGEDSGASSSWTWIPLNLWTSDEAQELVRLASVTVRPSEYRVRGSCLGFSSTAALSQVLQSLIKTSMGA